MLRTAKIFQSNMTLQQGENTKVFGTGEAGKTVKVAIQGQTAETVVMADGSWKLEIPELTASDMETLVITDGEETISLTNVAVGEVWIGGGQSNMEFWLRYEKYRKDGESVCEHPQIRFYDVPKIAYDGQEEEFDYSNVGIWRSATEKDLDYFSAIGYYFIKNIQEDLKIPIAFVGCAWGGTTSSVWMSHNTLAKVGQPWLDDYVAKIKDKDMEAYWKEQHGNPMNDSSNAQWSPFNEIILPSTPSMEELMKMFQAIETQTASQDANPELANMSMAEKMEMYVQMLQVQSIPNCLYEHMVKVIAPFSSRGFLWYQGESDDVPTRQALYKDMLTGLIGDWRDLWGKEDMPFLIVQLPGYLKWMKQENIDYMTIRRQQELVCDTVKNTYLCSIADVGEELDIHPKDKKTVGQRLSLLARKYTYGENILADAPRVIDIEKKEKELVLTFANAGAGLTLEDEELKPLDVQMDGQKLSFTTEVAGDQVIIATETALTAPVTISFAQEKWYQIHLYNSAHIPAIPFMKIC